MATNKATTTKATATGTKPVATPKNDTSVDRYESRAIKYYGKETVEEFKKRTKAIKDSIGKIDSSFETIAFNLYWVNSKEAYRIKGADSIAKYAADMFGYEKTTCYALIAVVERFAKRDENGNILEQFDERYKGYSSSKLSLMVGLTDEQIQTSLKPEMSVRDIKKFVASLREKPQVSLPDNKKPEIPVDKSNPSPAGYYSRNLFLVYDFDDYNSKIDKIDATIHKLYKEIPNVKIRIEIDSEEPIPEKWGDYTIPVSGGGI